MDPARLHKILEPNPECSNYGCTSKKNDEDLAPECLFHPGQPVFHEGYKFWACCKRKSISFEEFLKQKGCTSGAHNWDPRPEPVKDIECDEDTIVVNPTLPPEPEKITRSAMAYRNRPDHNAPLLSFEVEVSASLEKLITEGKHPVGEPPAVRLCQNSGCSVKEEDFEGNPTCYYHAGEAVFHEGLKYWSCCKKKAFEFEQFMKQKGCTEGQHRFLSEQKLNCRFDWHQTGTHVIVAIYAKGYNPSSVSIKANAVRVYVSFNQAAGVFVKDWTLNGIIEESNCHACLFPRKIEIKLKKAEAGYWTDFEYKGT